MRPSQKGVSVFATARFQAVASVQQSKELTASRRSAIVISSSGMATGGRVLHHMASALPHPRNTVLFVGYQAAGTRGRSLLDGAHELRIHGQAVPVQAHVAKIDSMSAHADRGEILRWLARRRRHQAGSVWCTVSLSPWMRSKLIAERFSAGQCRRPAHRETITV